MSFLDNLKSLFSLSKAAKNAQSRLDNINKEIAEAEEKRKVIDRLNNEIAGLRDKESIAANVLAETEKKLDNQKKRLNRSAQIIKSINNALEQFVVTGPNGKEMELQTELIALEPTVTIKSHGMNLKELRKQLVENNKLIEELLNIYRGRYTTKANASIYSLLVIALRAELQNVIYNLKFDKLDKAITSIQEMTRKYLAIVNEGNQSIAPTITRFIGQIEYLFIEAIKIEYEYFIKQEQIKEEQRAIREQMRQEAEERRLLEIQKKKLELEENKYQMEIKNVEALLLTADTPEMRLAYEQKIIDLNQQIASLESKKEEITKLQNGLAGYVYIISNLGAFGNQMFKIGMTRRQQPIDRINELGDASVPFGFDIHAMIFSNNAVGLENALHQHFSERRVNKINLRKEFFKATVEELQTYVNDLEPSAEFTTTMLAEQYRQTLALEAGLIRLTDVTLETEEDANDEEAVETAV